MFNTYGAVFGVALSTTVIALIPEPPIELQAVGYTKEANEFYLTRTVNSSEIIRSPFSVEVVDAVTERGVDGCYISRRSDFGRQEPTHQTWPIATVLGDECMASMVSGRSYYLIMTVTPLEGEPDVVRSAPFSIGVDARPDGL